MQLNRQSIVRPRRQAGVSNLQIMMGVLIGAILITGGTVMFGQVEKAKADNEVRELGRLKKKTVSLGAQRGTFTGVTLQTVVPLGFFEADKVSGAAGSRVVSNQWSGTIDVTGADFGGTGNALMYRYTGVSSAACKQIGMQAGSVISGMMVAGGWVKTTPALGGTGAVNVTELIRLCDRSTNNVTIDFYLTR